MELLSKEESRQTMNELYYTMARANRIKKQLDEKQADEASRARMMATITEIRSIFRQDTPKLGGIARKSSIAPYQTRHYESLPYGLRSAPKNSFASGKVKDFDYFYAIEVERADLAKKVVQAKHARQSFKDAGEVRQAYVRELQRLGGSASARRTA